MTPSTSRRRLRRLALRLRKPKGHGGCPDKIKPPGDRRFWSMFPLTRVPFGVPILDPQPFRKGFLSRDSLLLLLALCPGNGCSAPLSPQKERQTITTTSIKTEPVTRIDLTETKPGWSGG